MKKLYDEDDEINEAKLAEDLKKGEKLLRSARMKQIMSYAHQIKKNNATNLWSLCVKAGWSIYKGQSQLSDYLDPELPADTIFVKSVVGNEISITLDKIDMDYRFVTKNPDGWEYETKELIESIKLTFQLTGKKPVKVSCEPRNCKFRNNVKVNGLVAYTCPGINFALSKDSADKVNEWLDSVVAAYATPEYKKYMADAKEESRKSRMKYLENIIHQAEQWLEHHEKLLTAKEARKQERAYYRATGYEMELVSLEEYEKAKAELETIA